MASGRVASLSSLPEAARDVLTEARRAVLVTHEPDGATHAVPIGFAVVDDEIVTAIDDKPKTSARLSRLTNIEADPRVTFLVDRWDEDWTRLGWIMVQGTARVETPGFAVDALVARYPQYRDRPPQGDVIVVTPERIRYWTWA